MNDLNKTLKLSILICLISGIVIGILSAILLTWVLSDFSLPVHVVGA